MKKIDVLCWGLEHIAHNHGFSAYTDEVSNGEVCICGGHNIPTLADVKMLCVDLEIPYECIHVSPFGIDISLTWEWYDKKGNEEYETTGFEMWKRQDAVIC